MAKSIRTWDVGKEVSCLQIEIFEGNMVFEHSYVEEPYRKKGIWKKLNENRFKYASNKNKPIEVITKEEFLKDYWIKNGFEVYRQNGRYYYLRRDIDES